MDMNELNAILKLAGLEARPIDEPTAMEPGMDMEPAMDMDGDVADAEPGMDMDMDMDADDFGGADAADDAGLDGRDMKEANYLSALKMVKEAQVDGKVNKQVLKKAFEAIKAHK